MIVVDAESKNCAAALSTGIVIVSGYSASCCFLVSLIVFLRMFSICSLFTHNEYLRARVFFKKFTEKFSVKPTVPHTPDKEYYVDSNV